MPIIITAKNESNCWEELSRVSPRLSRRISYFVQQNVLEARITLSNGYVEVYPKSLEFYGTLDEINKMKETAKNTHLLYIGALEGNVKEHSLSFKGRISAKNRQGNPICEFLAKKEEEINFSMGHKKIRKGRNQNRFSLSNIRMRMNYEKNAYLLDKIVQILQK